MAARFTRHLGSDNVRVYSGGSEPADQINPVAVSAMAELGIDIATQLPQKWTDEVIATTDIVTMGCGDTCPYFPGVRYVDWELDDAAGRPIEQVRTIRDNIEQRVKALLTDLGVNPQPETG